MAKKSAHKSFRLRFPFWLDMNKPDEAELAEKIDLLKEERAFVKTIRDGIRLIMDLRAGRLEILFVLFPWVKEEFEKRVNIQSVSALQDQLTRLEMMMGQGMSTPSDTKPLPREPMRSGPKPLQAPAFALPQFDEDDDFTLNMQSVVDLTSTNNLVNSVKNM